MRLINADEIVTMCENVIQHGIADEDGDHVITAESMLFAVNHLPTIDAVTVRHGRWEKCLGKGLSCKCSVCASKYDIPWRYCPNCGARMDWKDGDQMTDKGCPDTLPFAQQEAIRRIEKKVVEVYGYPKTEYAEGYVNACKAAIKMLKNLSPVDDATTADTVPVVRCKDCKYWRRDTDHTCKEHSLVSPMLADGFCSRGKRKDGEQI